MNNRLTSESHGFQISRGYQVCVSCFHESILVALIAASIVTAKFALTARS